MLLSQMSDEAKRLSETWLIEFIAEADAVAGTIHHLRDGALLLEAAVNIPPKVQELTQAIPRGKGMAGLAWERNKPVQTCNLKDDVSGDVRPGATAVDAKGAIAIPVTNAAGEVVSVVGVAFADERELDDAAVAALSERARAVPR